MRFISGKQQSLISTNHENRAGEGKEKAYCAGQYHSSEQFYHLKQRKYLG
jgi:hypothetical protein